MDYKFITRFFLCMGCLICMACSHSNTFEDDLKSFLSKEVKLPLERMRMMCADSCNLRDVGDKDWKLVVYTSPYKCAPCVVNGMYHWNEFIAWEDSLHGNFELVFIFQPEKKDKKQLISSLKMSKLRSEAYVDTIGAFTEANPDFPEDERLHVFLLNKEIRVVLAGNPVENKKMRNLMRQTILKRKGGEWEKSKE